MCYDYTALTSLLNAPNVQAALGTMGRNYSVCSTSVGNGFAIDLYVFCLCVYICVCVCMFVHACVCVSELLV